MQLMSWVLARLGSRFTLRFEPHQRQIHHSAIGCFVDRPVDLTVGLIEPDGRARVLPFTKEGEVFYNAEQFERLNSITYRGYSERYRLRFEFNVHSVFYPQAEALCTMPVFYMEMRLHPAPQVRQTRAVGPTPSLVRLVIRINRPDTHIAATSVGGAGRIDLSYAVPLSPTVEHVAADQATEPSEAEPVRSVQVRERIASLNTGCTADEDGQGLSLELPVTKAASGVKWRLIWGAHCADPILELDRIGDEPPARGRFRYVRRLPDLDAVMDEAIRHRDVHLAHSRRFEKLFDEASLTTAQRHLINLSFQTYVANSFWCDLEALETGSTQPQGEWFSVWAGNCLHQSAVGVEYNATPLYLAVWPHLLALQLDQWARFVKPHEPSGGSTLNRDTGRGFCVTGREGTDDMAVEHNADFLLMLQAYAHWVGDLASARRHSDLIEGLAGCLTWSDVDQSGFPSQCTTNGVDNPGPSAPFARKTIYMAVKRIAGLQAAADLLHQVGRHDRARDIEPIVERDATQIETRAWLSDRYALCVDRSEAGAVDAWTDQRSTFENVTGWDAYSIYTANGLLLPAMLGQPLLLDHQRLTTDHFSATRETRGRYGCGHSSLEPESVWISQNIWREQMARYLGGGGPGLDQLYWDMQVMSNTEDRSLAFTDTYINHTLTFYPRGVTSIGFLLCGPRLVIDRLAPGGQRLSVDPDRHYPQRWPLLPLADWNAAKVPVCVVQSDGKVFIEGEGDPVIVRGQTEDHEQLIG